MASSAETTVCKVESEPHTDLKSSYFRKIADEQSRRVFPPSRTVLRLEASPGNVVLGQRHAEQNLQWPGMRAVLAMPGLTLSVRAAAAAHVWLIKGDIRRSTLPPLSLPCYGIALEGTRCLDEHAFICEQRLPADCLVLSSDDEVYLENQKTTSFDLHTTRRVRSRAIVQIEVGAPQNAARKKHMHFRMLRLRSAPVFPRFWGACRPTGGGGDRGSQKDQQ